MKGYPKQVRWAVLVALLFPACADPGGPGAAGVDERAAQTGFVPDWAADAVFYQIFPERFANGDPANDPTRASLEYVENAPQNWTVSPWTGDWYAQADWEREMGGFYESVFHRRYGGDLQGVLDRLDYLAVLGINTLYFNPVFYAASLHKYDGNTFHHIDPYFGPDPEGDLALIEAEDALDFENWTWTAADLQFLELLRAARGRGIRVIIDGVFNHTGRDFFAFKDIRARQAESPYRDWFVINDFDDPATDENEFDYEGWWGVETLPLFADNADGTDLHPGPKSYVFAATERWMDPNGDGDPEDGIAGWRLDVTLDVPVGFWADWNAHVRTINPQAYTVSEIWEPAAEFVEQAGFSATMNYWAFALPAKGFLIDQAHTATAFAEMLEDRAAEHAPSTRYALQNLLDSHDTDRIASMIVNADSDYREPEWMDYDRDVSPRHYEPYQIRRPNAEERAVQRLITLFQMTYIGAPMIYYGTEAGMWGADDPDDRMPMTWPEMTFADQATDPRGRARVPDRVGFDPQVFEYYQDLIALRHARPALRRGLFRVLDTDDDAATVSYLRATPEDAVLVVLNRGETEQTVVFSRSALPDGGASASVVAASSPGSVADLDAGYLRVTVPARTGAAVALTQSP